MKTTEETNSYPVSIWAIPKSNYAADDAPPFSYELRTDRPWQSGAVEVFATEVTITTPAGVDLLTKSIETLEAAIEEVKTNAFEEVHRLQQQINNLLQLEHITEE